MSDDRHNNSHLPPGEDGALALETLARLPRAQVANAARERARSAFLYGTGQDGAVVTQLKPRHSAARRWGGMMVAAVLSAIAIFWYGSTPDQQWVVLDVVNPGGIAVVQDIASAIGQPVNHGLIATGPESELEMQLGAQLRFRMVPGTTLELPRPPGRWFGRDRRLTVNSGEIYGTSGGRKLDFGLVFATDELQAQLTGTTFAVFRTDSASCVCLWAGGISVLPLIGPDAPIALEEKQRVWIYKDGRAPERLPLSDMEIMKLQMIHDAGLFSPDSAP
ncbi:MAG: hypothetical protein QNL91_13180 [Candidatus Krumholzibacteria bacterium]|nr:hypothetical protein [Candidatus Krumholzibacteria bacterium]